MLRLSFVLDPVPVPVLVVQAVTGQMPAVKSFERSEDRGFGGWPPYKYVITYRIAKQAFYFRLLHLTSAFIS